MKFKNNTIDNPVAFFEEFCSYEYDKHLESFYKGVEDDHMTHITNKETHEGYFEELDEFEGKFKAYPFSFDIFTSKSLKQSFDSCFENNSVLNDFK